MNHPELATEGPAAARAVFGKVLAGYVDRPEGADAVALGWDLAALGAGGLSVVNVTAAHVIPARERSDPGTLVSDSGRPLQGAMEGLGLAFADRRRAGGKPGSFSASTVASTSPAHGLHDLAEDGAYDLVVIGSSHRHGPARALLGSVALRLLHGAPCPVALAPHGYAHGAPRPPAAIAVAFDGSDEAWLALALAGSLAEAAGAQVTLLTVVEPLAAPIGRWIPLDGGATELGLEQYGETLERRWLAARAMVEEAAAGLPQECVAAPRLLSGDPAQCLSAETRAGFDLLLMGSRGYGPAGRVLLGSASAAALTAPSCPVIVTPRGATARP